MNKNNNYFINYTYLLLRLALIFCGYCFLYTKINHFANAVIFIYCGASYLYHVNKERYKE